MEDIRKQLFSLADEKYRRFHSSLCPGTNNIIGIRVPVLRSIAKEIVKGNWADYLQHADNKYYEEIMLQAMVMGLAKMDLEKRLTYIRKFVPKINNWAVCDVSCAGFTFTKKYLEKVWEFLKPYLNSNQEFEIRFGVVMLLDYYITRDYITEVLEILNQIQHEGYYVKMAIAWAISVCYIKFPEQTLTLFQNNNLDTFTYNKALQKIIESNRVTKGEKEKIRVMKRKE